VIFPLLLYNSMSMDFVTIVHAAHGIPPEFGSGLSAKIKTIKQKNRNFIMFTLYFCGNFNPSKILDQ
jgi:hypothetical protein